MDFEHLYILKIKKMVKRLKKTFNDIKVRRSGFNIKYLLIRLINYNQLFVSIIETCSPTNYNKQLCRQRPQNEGSM